MVVVIERIGTILPFETGKRIFRVSAGCFGRGGVPVPAVACVEQHRPPDLAGTVRRVGVGLADRYRAKTNVAGDGVDWKETSSKPALASHAW